MKEQLLYKEPSFEVLEVELRDAVMAGSGNPGDGGPHEGGGEGGEMGEGGEV